AERDGRVVALHGQAELEVGVQGGGIGKEIGGSVFEPLVEGEDGQGPVPCPVGVEHPPEPDALAVPDGEAGGGGPGGRGRGRAAPPRDGLTLSFHFDNLQTLSFYR